MIKPIEGFEDRYMITDTGEVYSIFSKRFISKEIDHDGYYRVHLSKDNRKKHEKINRLVACAFLPNPENKPEVNHIDGNKTNNSVSNLEWCSHLENRKHAIATGLWDMNGEKSPNAKLTWDAVKQIRSEYIARDREHGGEALARRYGVSAPLILMVVHNKIWREKYE